MKLPLLVVFCVFQEKETTKQEVKKIEEVAKHMRANVPTKKAIIKGENVEYFVGERLMLQSLSFYIVIEYYSLFT